MNHCLVPYALCHRNCLKYFFIYPDPTTLAEGLNTQKTKFPKDITNHSTISARSPTIFTSNSQLYSVNFPFVFCYIVWLCTCFSKKFIYRVYKIQNYSNSKLKNRSSHGVCLHRNIKKNVFFCCIRGSSYNKYYIISVNYG